MRHLVFNFRQWACIIEFYFSMLRNFYELAKRSIQLLNCLIFDTKEGFITTESAVAIDARIIHNPGSTRAEFFREQRASPLTARAFSASFLPSPLPTLTVYELFSFTRQSLRHKCESKEKRKIVQREKEERAARRSKIRRWKGGDQSWRERERERGKRTSRNG